MTIAEKLSESNKVTLPYKLRPRPGKVGDEGSSTNTSKSSNQSEGNLRTGIM